MNEQTAAGLIQVLIPVLVPLIVAALKRMIGGLPKPLIPVIAILLGAGIDILTQLMGAGSPGIFQGAILGAAGVGVRELLDQLKKTIIVEGEKK